MKWSRLIGWGLLARRVSRQLDRIARALDVQNVVLVRLADHFAPQIPEPADLQHQSSVDFLNHEEAGRVLSYIERTMHDTGRAPSEDEILSYLADEATLDLHERLEQKRAAGTA